MYVMTSIAVFHLHSTLLMFVCIYCAVSMVSM